MRDAEADRIFQFNVRQYEDLRKSLLAVNEEERQMERYVLLASAVFYSWLATQATTGKAFLVVASFIPTVIVILAGLRAHALANGIRTTAQYLRDLEAQIYSHASDAYTGPRGWETFVAANARYVSKYEATERLFWYLLLAVTLVAAFAFLLLRS